MQAFNSGEEATRAYIHASVSVNPDDAETAPVNDEEHRYAQAKSPRFKIKKTLLVPRVNKNWER